MARLKILEVVLPEKISLIDYTHFSHNGTEGVLVAGEIDLIPLERYEE